MRREFGRCGVDHAASNARSLACRAANFGGVRCAVAERVGATDQRRSRRTEFQWRQNRFAAPSPRGAGRAARKCDGMAMRSEIRLTVDEQGRADARADADIEERRVAAPGPESCLRQCGGAYI